ncbi:hypothetical protein BDV95DRAFT_221751 [Massariosphaeria phaeospora]|uniref:Uncharacterized protein n=1 Tax=Massariosphaeria phaeospora TaxID=100035 RepID=A0A7C8MBK9_9PLEO|nr:hypothetical protein BDV95DRAFT_221751 [Massariosphaeria phaeospora]
MAEHDGVHEHAGGAGVGDEEEEGRGSGNGNSVAVVTAPAAVGFFDMPREIRDDIYHLIWKEEQMVSVPYRGSTFMIEYDKRPYSYRCKKPLPTWLLTNKAMLEEGLAQFQRKSKCFWPAKAWCATTFSQAATRDDYVKAIYGWDPHNQHMKSPLLVPFTYEALSMKVKTKREDNFTHARLYDDLQPVLQPVAMAVRESDKLTCLRISVNISSLVITPHIQQYTVDFSPLDVFEASVEKVDITVFSYSICVRFWQAEQLRKAAARETARIGKLLVRSGNVAQREQFEGGVGVQYTFEAVDSEAPAALLDL